MAVQNIEAGWRVVAVLPEIVLVYVFTVQNLGDLLLLKRRLF